MGGLSHESSGCSGDAPSCVCSQRNGGVGAPSHESSICDKNYQGTKLDELVNYSPNLPFLRCYGEQEYETGTPSFDADNIVNFNRRNLTILYPEGNDRVPTNYNPQIGWFYGCQFVCMHWQIIDDNMSTYISKFKNHSFILKPCKLTYRPPVYEKPSEQDPNLYFNTMLISTPFIQRKYKHSPYNIPIPISIQLY